MSDVKNALQTRAENPTQGIANLSGMITDMVPEFQRAMPRGMEAKQLMRDAITALRQNPKLAQCDHMSVLGGLMTCAQLGLRPGVLGQAWIMPFWDNATRGHRAQLVVGYQGYIELAYRSGRVRSISARAVHQHDEFDLVYTADGDTLTHRPRLDGDRGPIRLFYARAQLADGGYALTDPMSLAEMEAYRDRHAKARTKDGRIFGPWADNFAEMGLKTMIRRLSKVLPKSTELAVAIAIDDGIRMNIDPACDAAAVTDHIVVESTTTPPDTTPTVEVIDEWPAVRKANK